ncbi:hypothetical protein ECC02_009320 [Trypanosoma cruzi]|uniref:Dispersed protein family protein 1 (DGF-1) n=1 Tax=Trypanosoma cruzi TaxID=5693 RepID=A0A7J6XVB0_TRYCR|nr:hypothetical protein ECC02_009320 [Trypanosoma cruzi]
MLVIAQQRLQPTTPRLAQLLPVAVLRVPHNDAVHSGRKQHSRQQQHDSRVRPRTAVARRKMFGRAHQAQCRKEHKARSLHHRQKGQAHHVREGNHARARKQHSRHAEVLNVAASHGRVHSRNQAHHAQHRQLEHAPVHVAAPHVRQHATVHPLLRCGVPIPDGVQQALVQRLPRKLPVPRKARARVASNKVAHASRERHTVQHANDTNHAVPHAGAGHRQCEHGAEKDAEVHRVRHDVRQAREAHRRPRTRRVHAAPPLEGGRHTAVHAPEHSGEQRVAHHHPQRVKGSEHRQEVRQRNGARTLLRRGAWHPRKHAECLHLQNGAQPAGHHHSNSRRTRNDAGDRREGAGSGGQRVRPDREGPKQHTLAAAGHRRSVAANDYRLVGSNEVTAVHGHSQLQDGGRIRRVAHPRRVAQHRSPRTAKPVRLRRRHRHKAQVRAELRVACPPKRRRQRRHQPCRDGAPTAADVVLRQAPTSRRRRHGERRARHVAPPRRAAHRQAHAQCLRCRHCRIRQHRPRHRRRMGQRGRQRHRLRHLQRLRRPVPRRTVVRCAQARCWRPRWCRRKAARPRQRLRVAQQWLGGSAVASFHVRQVHRQAVAPVPALSTAAAARPRHRPRRSSKAAHVGVAHATRHGTEFPDDAGGPVVHRLQHMLVKRQAPHDELSAGTPERNATVHHDKPAAGVPVKRQRALHEVRTARVRRHRQEPAADAVAAHRQPRPGRKRRRPPQHQQRAIGQRTGVVIHNDGGRGSLHLAVEHQPMRGVHLAPRHAQHSAPRRNHARTRVQRIVATEHSRVQRDTATDKLQHGAVHHHSPPTSHHGHEGHAGHNQHGPHKPQARQHKHRCVRRGLRVEKIHKRRRHRGNQQRVGHRQHRPRGKRAGQHKRTVQRLHIAHRQLHRPALVAPHRHRTAQRSAAHHVQHGAVQQRHVLHNDPHALSRHPRHVEHRTHAVQHNVAQRHLARTGRHNKHRPHRHALADEHTRRSAHSGRQHGSAHRHARLAVPAAAARAHAHTVRHARRRSPGRVAVRVPVAGVAPSNVDAPSVAKTSGCVLLRRRQDTSTCVVARHPQMRPSRKRQAQRQHPRQQRSVPHKAQRAPCSGHGTSGVEHLPRDTVVHVALHQQHRPTSQAHRRIKRHRVVLRQREFAPHKRHSGAQHAHSPTHRHRVLAQQEVAVNKRHHGATAGRNTALHRHAQPQRRLHRQPVHVQRTARRQRHAANHQHANSVAEHSRHMRARNGQHAPSQIHAVHHKARGRVAKAVGATVRNTLLCDQHRVHQSDARARRKSVRHQHAAAGARLKPADQHIGALASRRVGTPPNNVQARSVQKRAVRQRHVAHAPRHRLHVHHDVRRKGHTNVARHRRPETGAHLLIHTHVPHAQVCAVGARWLGDSNGQARIAVAALCARAGAAITRGHRRVSGEARRREGAWIAAGQNGGVVHGRDAVFRPLLAVHSVARGHNRSVCDIAGPGEYPQNCRRDRAGHESVAGHRHHGVTEIHCVVYVGKGFRWGFTAEVVAQLQP